MFRVLMMTLTFYGDVCFADVVGGNGVHPADRGTVLPVSGQV